MFYIPNRNRVRQLKKAVFFHQTSGITTKFWQRYRNKSLQRNKKSKTKDYLLCLWNTLANRYQKCYIGLQKMDTPRVRARQVFSVFCLHPSPPCLTSWFTTNCRWRQRPFLPSPPVTYLSSLAAAGKYRTKTRKRSGLWTKTCQPSCQNPQQSKRLPHSGEGKGEHKPSPFPSPHRFDLLHLIQVGEGWRQKNEKLRCAHALPRARKCTFPTTPDSLSRNIAVR